MSSPLDQVLWTTTGNTSDPPTTPRTYTAWNSASVWITQRVIPSSEFERPQAPPPKRVEVECEPATQPERLIDLGAER